MSELLPGHEFITIRSFNVKRGCVILMDERVPTSGRVLGRFQTPFIVTKVSRNIDWEVITITGRWDDSGVLLDQDVTDVFKLDWGMGDRVKLIGISVNPDDEDDRDFGVELTYSSGTLVEESPNPVLDNQASMIHSHSITGDLGTYSDDIDYSKQGWAEEPEVEYNK